MTPGMEAVLRVLTGKRFSLENEKRTQNEIWSVLEANPVTWMPRREQRIAGGIIDFLLESHTDKGTRFTGIEVKLKGQKAAIIRQLQAYAREPSLDGLVLVTAIPVALGPTVGKKPVAVLELGRAWL